MATSNTPLTRMTSCSFPPEAILLSSWLATRARRPITRPTPTATSAISKTRITRAPKHQPHSSTLTVSTTSAVAPCRWHTSRTSTTSSRRTSSYSAFSRSACGTFTRISRSRRTCPRVRTASASALGTGSTSPTRVQNRVSFHISKNSIKGNRSSLTDFAVYMNGFQCDFTGAKTPKPLATPKVARRYVFLSRSASRRTRLINLTNHEKRTVVAQSRRRAWPRGRGTARRAQSPRSSGFRRRGTTCSRVIIPRRSTKTCTTSSKALRTTSSWTASSRIRRPSANPVLRPLRPSWT